MPRSWFILGGSIIVIGSLLTRETCGQNQPNYEEGRFADYNDFADKQPSHEQLRSVTPPCCVDSSVHDAHLLFLSTMDGMVWALDALNGQLVWKANIHGAPLMAGSLGRLQPMEADGRLFNLVPSLDGSLYMYSREEKLLEPIPLNAEMLLQASVRIGHEAVAGGKSVSTTGVDPLTGKIRYHCSSSECSSTDSGLIEATLVLRRNTHAVRAVDALSGSERWNLSVSELEASLVLKDVLAKTHSSSNPSKIRFLLQPPDGIITAVDSCGTQIWSRQVDNHIAKVWRMEHGQLNEISLFDSDNIHTLSLDTNSDISQLIQREESLFYLGTLKNEPFIIHSMSVKNELRRIARNAVDHGESSRPHETQLVPTSSAGYFVQDSTLGDMLSFSYRQSFSAKKLLSTGNSESNKLHVISHGKEEYHSCRKSDSVALISEKDIKRAAFHSNEDGDQGWFVLKPPSFTPSKAGGGRTRCAATLLGQVDESLTRFWGISLAMFCTVTFTGLATVAAFFFYRGSDVKPVSPTVSSLGLADSRQTKSTGCGPSVRGDSDSNASEPVLQKFTRSSRERRTTSSNDSCSADQFHSKFQLDFEPVKLIGYGGFGVVFKAMNRLDEAMYAVKRIAVENHERAIQRVLREVRAMAKLDHPGIIRYYHTWIEKPPIGWQEELDSTLLKEMRKRKCPIQENPYKEKSDRMDSVSFSGDNGFPAMPENVSEGSWLDESKSTGVPPAALTELPADGDGFSQSSQGSANVVLIRSCEQSDNLIVFENDGNQNSSGSSDNVDCLPNQVVLVTSMDEELQPSSTVTNYVYLYIQMQLCQERTLHSWLTEHNSVQLRSKPKMKSWLVQICSALSYIHQQGLIHRDVKPQNIFFSADNNLKIGDLGLVTQCVPAEDQPIEKSYKRPVSVHTDNVGTKGYMSPEQLRNEPYTYKVDVFSLGLIFCELIFPFQTFMERSKTFGALQRGEYPDVLQFFNDLDRQLVLWMTHFHPDERPSCEEILQHTYFCE